MERRRIPRCAEKESGGVVWCWWRGGCALDGRGRRRRQHKPGWAGGRVRVAGAPAGRARRRWAPRTGLKRAQGVRHRTVRPRRTGLGGGARRAGPASASRHCNSHTSHDAPRHRSPVGAWRGCFWNLEYRILYEGA